MAAIFDRIPHKVQGQTRKGDVERGNTLAICHPWPAVSFAEKMFWESFEWKKQLCDELLSKELSPLDSFNNKLKNFNRLPLAPPLFLPPLHPHEALDASE